MFFKCLQDLCINMKTFFFSCITEVQCASVTVGRFQVSPSMHIPAPAAPIGAPPAAPQPAGSVSTPSESSTEEQCESETSLGTSLTMSPPHQYPNRGSNQGGLQEVDGQVGWAGSKEKDREEDEDEEVEVEEVVGERQRTRKRCRKRAYSLLGTSADSGLSVAAAEVDGRLWDDGAAGTPQYSNALHHLWTMNYNRNNPYISSDDSDSDDLDIVEELQELRDK